MGQGDNKGIWTALYVFGGFKGLAGLVLAIVGIILMTQAAPDCDKMQKCDWEKIGGLAKCKTDMKALSDEGAKWGAALLVIGLIGSLSGGLSGFAAKKKDKTAIGFSMCIDLIMTIVCIAMGFLVGIVAGVMKLVCDHWKACEELTKDTCKKADLFGTAAIMFYFMFVVVFCTLIVDCSATCCCPPDDAPWSAKNQGVQGARPQDATASSKKITGP